MVECYFFCCHLMVSVITMCNLIKRLIRTTFLSTPASDESLVSACFHTSNRPLPFHLHLRDISKFLDSETYGSFHLSEQACQTIAVLMGISLLIKTIQPDICQIVNSMHEGDDFSAKTLGKSLLLCQNDFWKAPLVSAQQKLSKCNSLQF